MAELRPYQQTVIDGVAAEIAAGRRRLLGVAPTGSGKTVIAVELAHRAVVRGQRVLFLVHRREIIRQTSQKLYKVGLDHGIIAPGFPSRPAEPVQVGSIATVHIRAVKTSKIRLPDGGLVIVDEAHHATAPTWRRIIDSYPNAILIGLTATPCRTDGHGLGGIFESLVQCPDVSELIKLDYLVPAKVFAPSAPDLSGVHVRGGDYVESELAERVNTAVLVGDVIEHWLRHADCRRTVVFCVNVAHSVHLRDEFCKSDITAEHIDGSTPLAERDAILGRLKAGITDVVCNCAVLTEGWDLPELGCVVLARPTKSFLLYRQMVGRGLRPAEGKDHLLVLDHAGATLAHGMIDDPVLWSLDPEKKATRASSVGLGHHAGRQMMGCPECRALFWKDEGHCRNCGWAPRPKAKPVDWIDEDLVEIGSKPHTHGDDEKRITFNQLEFIRLGRRKADGSPYNPGWTANKFRDYYGHWPPRWWQMHARPEPPAPALRRWVRSRDIAHARARR